MLGSHVADFPFFSLIRETSLGIRWWVITPSTSPFFFFSRFNLGVAMVAMVAMSSFADFPPEVQAC